MRRFFDVSDLAGVRMEDPEVFEATHARCSSSSREGVVDGIRVDHPDGLAEPAALPRRLREAGRRARLGREDPRARRAAARVAGRGHDGLRVPERFDGALRRPGRRGAADRAVSRAHRRRRPFEELAHEAKLEQATDDVRARGRSAARATRRRAEELDCPRARFVPRLPHLRRPRHRRRRRADRQAVAAARLPSRLAAILLLEERGHDRSSSASSRRRRRSWPKGSRTRRSTAPGCSPERGRR